MTQNLPDNAILSGVYRRAVDGSYIAAVSPFSYMSVPEVRAGLAEILGISAHEVIFTLFQAAETLEADAISEEALESRKFHRMTTPDGPVQTLLAERVLLTLPDGALLSMDDNVRDLGGDSLFCLELSEAVIDLLNAEMDPVDIFRATSLACLAADIEAKQ